MGVVMFGKALVLALYAAFDIWWSGFKKRHREHGLPMRQGKDGVYRPHDWTHIAETWAWRVIWTGAALFFLYGCFALYLLTTAQ